MDGPEGGLTLDAAVDRLIAFNYDLRTKYQDISEARADELTASWGLGVLLPIPMFNRNQGNIQRARVNLTQIQIGLEAMSR
jgi:outer membrane protein TolC